MAQWDFKTDVVIVGSGAAGLSAALFAALKGLDCIILEKTEQWGGTTAISKGLVWVPNHAGMKAAGIADSEHEALAYVKALAGNVDSGRLSTFIEHAPRMLKTLQANSELQFSPMPRCMDHYPDLQGFKPGGRTLEPRPTGLRQIGDQADGLRQCNTGPVLNRYSLTAAEEHSLATFSKGARWIRLKHSLRYWLDIPMRLRSRDDRRQTMGQALVTGLRKTLLQHKVPLWTNARVLKLLSNRDDRVCGVAIKLDGELKTVKARRAVVLASGGFARNTKLRQRFQYPFVADQWTAASNGDSGDAIPLGLGVGAALDHMHCAWWAPSYRTPDGVAEALLAGKSLPGSIFVNASGRRFVNEARPGEDLSKIQLQSHARERNNLPCYMLVDARYRKNYPIGPIRPASVQPDGRLPAGFLGDEFLIKADSLAELAGMLGIDAHRLQQTIDRFNGFVNEGRDRDFQRGDSLYDRYHGDQRVKPNPCLGRIDQAPYYALRIFPGDLGTKGGLKSDQFARVLKADGEHIPGLYAAGNCAAPVLGDACPAPGASISAAMSFSFIAVEHISAN